MHLSLRGTLLARGALLAAAATAACFWTDFAAAGDDGAAPLWVGIGSIFGPLLGMGKEEKAPIDYQEHGKIVLPPKVDLPPPDPPATQTGGEWPVDQEIQHKKIAKEEAKKEIAGEGDARLRYTHPFPPTLLLQSALRISRGPRGPAKAIRPRLRPCSGT